MSDLSILAATSFRSPHDLGPEPDLKTAAREFEGYLLGEVLRLSEESSLHEGGVFDGGSGGKMMRSMFHQEVARLLAEQGGFGIAETIEAQGPGTPATAAADERPEEPR